MPRYYFDTRDGDSLIEDDVGLEFDGLEEVKDQAAMSLAELARDVLPGCTKRVLAVDVRDDTHPVLRALLTFEAIILDGVSRDGA